MWKIKISSLKFNNLFGLHLLKYPFCHIFMVKMFTNHGYFNLDNLNIKKLI